MGTIIIRGAIMQANISKEEDYWVSPQCVNDDGTVMKFIKKDYLIRYLRYLREKNDAKQ